MSTPDTFAKDADSHGRRPLPVASSNRSVLSTLPLGFVGNHRSRRRTFTQSLTILHALPSPSCSHSAAMWSQYSALAASRFASATVGRVSVIMTRCPWLRRCPEHHLSPPDPSKEFVE